MSFDPWRHLDFINAHLDDLRSRRGFAEAMGRVERAEELGREIVMAEAKRARLVEWIVRQVAEPA
jgi:hypothetical protein